MLTTCLEFETMRAEWVSWLSVPTIKGEPDDERHGPFPTFGHWQFSENAYHGWSNFHRRSDRCQPHLIAHEDCSGNFGMRVPIFHSDFAVPYNYPNAGLHWGDISIWQSQESPIDDPLFGRHYCLHCHWHLNMYIFCLKVTVGCYYTPFFIRKRYGSK